MRQGWIDLGHKDSEINDLLQNLPGQPFALRNLDGSENEKLDSFGTSLINEDDENPSAVLKGIKDMRKIEPLNPGFAAMNAAAMGELAKEHATHDNSKLARPARQPEPIVKKAAILEEDDDTQRPS